MATKIGVGISKQINSFQAGRDAAFNAKVALQSDVISCALVFSSVNFNLQDVLRGIRLVIKSAPLIGASGAGIITNAGSQKRAVAVKLIASSNIQLAASAIGPIISGRERISGRELAQKAVSQIKGFPRHAFTLFSDSLINRPSSLISGIQEILGVSFPIVGGFSADDGRLGKTYQFFGEEVFENSACGLLWAGDCVAAVAKGHGWKPLGRPLIVTNASGNRIRSIENKPAIKVYEEYFGENVKDLKQSRLSKISLLYPLGFHLSKEDGYILRNVSRVEKDGSLIFSGTVPEGEAVHLMLGTKDSLIIAAKETARLVMKQLSEKQKKIKLAIVTDSFSRLKLLGRYADKEIEAIKSELGSNVPIIGFYSFGEQAPLSALNYMGKSYILSESINILGIGE